MAKVITRRKEIMYPSRFSWAEKYNNICMNIKENAGCLPYSDRFCNSSKALRVASSFYVAIATTWFADFNMQLELVKLSLTRVIICFTCWERERKKIRLQKTNFLFKKERDDQY